MPITTSSFAVWQPQSTLHSQHDDPFSVDSLLLSRRGSTMSLASNSNAANETKFWSEEETDDEVGVEHPKKLEIKEIIQLFEQVFIQNEIKIYEVLEVKFI